MILSYVLFHELDTLITRVGQDSKIMFAGDVAQTDLRKSNGDRAGPERFKIILQIPFTTKKNKEQKLKKLRFDLKILDVEIKKEKAATVSELNPEEDESDTLLDYAVGLEIETDMTRSEMENNLEPDYKILKIKEV